MCDMKLWMLHIQGPDDVVAAPSKDEAEKVAAAFNNIHGEWLAKRRAETATAGGDPDNWPTVKAVVVKWDSTAAAHADSVKKYWPEYAEYLSIPAT
jgi:membrane-bound lytic murein transglycosylase MltF